MQTIARLALIVCAACCALAMPVRAADGVYAGTATVAKGGNSPGCLTRRLKITVTGDRFTFGGVDSAPIAGGAVKPDGAFSTVYSSPGARTSVQVNLDGRIEGNKATGTMSSASGCVQAFASTAQ